MSTKIEVEMVVGRVIIQGFRRQATSSTSTLVVATIYLGLFVARYIFIFPKTGDAAHFCHGAHATAGGPLFGS